jgi:hypothetical protein
LSTVDTVNLDELIEFFDKITDTLPDLDLIYMALFSCKRINDYKKELEISQKAYKKFPFDKFILYYLANGIDKYIPDSKISGLFENLFMIGMGKIIQGSKKIQAFGKTQYPYVENAEMGAEKAPEIRRGMMFDSRFLNYVELGRIPEKKVAAFIYDIGGGRIKLDKWLVSNTNELPKAVVDGTRAALAAFGNLKNIESLGPRPTRLLDRKEQLEKIGIVADGKMKSELAAQGMLLSFERVFKGEHAGGPILNLIKADPQWLKSIAFFAPLRFEAIRNDKVVRAAEQENDNSLSLKILRSILDYLNDLGGDNMKQGDAEIMQSYIDLARILNDDYVNELADQCVYTMRLYAAP